MKYKTTIKITSEASNKDEAMEIVGEYLSGYITSGVDMKCTTGRVHNYTKPIIGIMVTSIMLVVAILSISHEAPVRNFLGSTPSINAVQPPLKTSVAKQKDEFRKKWQNLETKKGLERIKK